MSEILDSGARREFESGAVRDIAEGKGRCDLLPLNEVSVIIGSYLDTSHALYPKDGVLENIDLYVKDGDITNLYKAVFEFINREGMHPCTAILELAKHYEDGLKKYPERNWEKGLSLKCFIDSGIRHYLKHLRGDNDEPHNRAFMWNIVGAIWTHMNRPECIDLPFLNKDTQPFDQSTAPVSEKEDFRDRAKRMEERMSKYRETSFA